MMAADMGAAAGKAALEKAGVSADEIDLLVVSTATPDRFLPSTACDVQAAIGASQALAFDITAACTGFLYAVATAEGYISVGRAKKALVVSTEKMSAIVDWEDRSTCVLFGDGAGAAVITGTNDESGILSSHLRSDGNLGELLWRPAGGCRLPFSLDMLQTKGYYLQMRGREIFKSAVRSMADACRQAVADAGLGMDDIDYMIPHQANIRIIEATAKRANFPMDRVFINVDRYGNMSSASVPVALDESIEQGLVGPGSVVLQVAFGAGLTWGASVTRL
jgi:3-oxoacyl-[acyl-carrier-protein] synthase-3